MCVCVVHVCACVCVHVCVCVVHVWVCVSGSVHCVCMYLCPPGSHTHDKMSADPALPSGESVPAAKTSLPRVVEAYLPDKHKCHTLFGGTYVIQTRRSNDSRTLAVVVRTGRWW